MAATSTSYTSDGVTANYAVGFSYTSRSFVKVYIGGVLSGSWNWLNATTIHLTVVPANGTSIVITRVTSTTPIVDFVAAATITESDLDTAIGQCLDILEENQNNSVVGMQQSGGNWDATSDRIINVATPLASTDAANKAYVDSTTGSAAAAAASAAAALVSEGNALTYAGAASTSATNAANSAAAASASASSFTSALPITGLTVDEVPVANSATTYDAIAVRLTKRLSSGTPSAVASFDIALPGTHDEYLLDLYNFVMSNAGADVQLRFSTDGGATYAAAGTDYDYAMRGENNGATVTNQSNADSKIILAGPLNNTVNQAQLLTKIFPGAGGIIYNTLQVEGTLQHNGQESYYVYGSGRMTVSATRATHLRILASAGNITGNYVLYGVKR